MLDAATAVLPVVLLLIVGWALRARPLPDPTFWRGLEWLSYWIFMPALFVGSIARTDIGGISAGPVLLSLIVPIVVTGLIVLAVCRVLRVDGPRRTSLLQGSVRINTYVGLLLATGLNGPEGLGTFAIASAVVVPLVNVMAVVALTIHGDPELRHATSLPRELVGNPLILGCLVGLALNLSGVGLPEPLGTPVDLLATPTMVCGTLVAGAAITLRLPARDLLDIALISLIKLVALPFAAGVLAHTLGVSGPMAVSIVLICALPTAPSAYILARRLGGDADLMASISGAQTVLAVITLPLVIALHAPG